MMQFNVKFQIVKKPCSVTVINVEVSDKVNHSFQAILLPRINMIPTFHSIPLEGFLYLSPWYLYQLLFSSSMLQLGNTWISQHPFSEAGIQI